jgi:hypothetical protein
VVGVVAAVVGSCHPVPVASDEIEKQRLDAAGPACVAAGRRSLDRHRPVEHVARERQELVAGRRRQDDRVGLRVAQLQAGLDLDAIDEGVVVGFERRAAGDERLNLVGQLLGRGRGADGKVAGGLEADLQAG